MNQEYNSRIKHLNKKVKRQSRRILSLEISQRDILKKEVIPATIGLTIITFILMIVMLYFVPDKAIAFFNKSILKEILAKIFDVELFDSDV